MVVCVASAAARVVCNHHHCCRRVAVLAATHGITQTHFLQRADVPIACANEPPSPQLPPAVQLTVLLAAYSLHVVWLSDVTLPFRLSPAHQVDVSLENLIGGAAVAFFSRGVRRSHRHVTLPWGTIRTARPLLLQTSGTLLAAYFLSGYVGAAVQLLLTCAVAAGTPLSVAQHRALHVLGTHLAWVAMGVRVLSVRLKPFFPPPFGTGTWLAYRWRADWLGWALGGYFTSLLAYNSVDAISQALTPAAAAVADAESLAARLVNPENGARA